MSYCIDRSAKEASEATHQDPAAALMPSTPSITAMRDASREGAKKVMMLFVIGGLTYLEIAACRFLSRDPNFPYTIVLATTKLVKADSLLASVACDWENRRDTREPSKN